MTRKTSWKVPFYSNTVPRDPVDHKPIIGQWEDKGEHGEEGEDGDGEEEKIGHKEGGEEQRATEWKHRGGGGWERKKQKNKKFKEEEEEDEENIILSPIRSQLALHERHLLPSHKCCHMTSPILLPLSVLMALSCTSWTPDVRFSNPSKTCTTFLNSTVNYLIINQPLPQK